MTKSDFTITKLEEKIIETSKLNGHSDPIDYLNEILEGLNDFKNDDFKHKVYIELIDIFKQNAKLFWNHGHREQIKTWLYSFNCVGEYGYLENPDDIKSYKNINLVETIFDERFNEKLISSEKPEFTVAEIALYHAWTGDTIIRGNAFEIATKNGHKSGSNLFNIYSSYTTKSNRINKNEDETSKKLENKIKLFEKVCLRLIENSTQQKNANQEISILKQRLTDFYK